MPRVTWSMLLTESLKQGKTQYINRVPQILLQGAELQHLQYLQQCSQDGYIPQLDTFKEDNIFLSQFSELPLNVLHREFTEQRRDEVIADAIAQHIRDTGSNSGISKVTSDIYERTRIPNPEIIAYSQFDRRQLEQDIYRIATGINPFDRIFGGCLLGGEIVTLMAPVKSFKTTILRLLAEYFFHGVDDFLSPGVSVLLCSQEMSQASMLSLMDFQRLGKNAGNTRQGIPQEIMEMMVELQNDAKHLEQELYISPAVKTAQQVMDMYYGVENRPKVIIIDGFNLMGGNSDNSYTSIGAEIEALKNFAIKENVIIIGATQSNRAGLKEGLNLDHSNLAGSYAISMWTDFLLSCVTRDITLPGETQSRKHVIIQPVLCRGVGDAGNAFAIEFRFEDDEFTPIFSKLPENWAADEMYIVPTETMVKQAGSTEFQALATLVGEDAAKAVVTAMVQGDELDPF